MSINSPQDPHSETGPKETILIVDDTPQNLTVLGELLQPLYRVRAANSGERALRAAALFEELGAAPHVFGQTRLRGEKSHHKPESAESHAQKSGAMPQCGRHLAKLRRAPR